MKKALAFLLVGIIVIFSGCVEARLIKKESTVSLDQSASGAFATEAIKTTETQVSTEPVIDESKPMIALTFDDGPNENARRLLDILKKYDSKATFFVVGNRIDGNEDILKRMADEGHNIGGHGWDHSDLATLKKKEVSRQIELTNTKIFKASGYKSNIMRPPYGSWDSHVKKIAKKNDISLINWDIDTLDWSTKNKKKINKVIMKEVRDGCIILCHDLYDSTIDAMEAVIPKLIKQGYQLVTVTDLLNSQDGKMKPGMVYYNRWTDPR